MARSPTAGLLSGRALRRLGCEPILAGGRNLSKLAMPVANVTRSPSAAKTAHALHHHRVKGLSAKERQEQRMPEDCSATRLRSGLPQGIIAHGI